MKIMTVLGTRPEIIRLSRVMAALDRYFDHVVVHTGQNHDYELNQIFFEDLELRKPKYFLDSAGRTAAETVGRVITQVDAVLAQETPDALLVLGDTNSSLAAYSAKRRRIPIFHMEAGNRCFDERVPEETNRRIVDHIADINLPYSSISREYLIAEGLPADRIIKTGSPLHEVLTYFQPKIDQSAILQQLGLKVGEYFVVSAHREENIESPVQFRRLVELLEWLPGAYGLPVVVSTHPRTLRRIVANDVTMPPMVRLIKPLAFTEYVKLQTNSHAVLSDSGTITEESSLLNFPAVNIRQAHERPEGMEEGAVMMTGLSLAEVALALRVLENQPRSHLRLLRPVSDYLAPHVSEKIARILISYTPYVRRIVWRERDPGEIKVSPPEIRQDNVP